MNDVQISDENKLPAEHIPKVLEWNKRLREAYREGDEVYRYSNIGPLSGSFGFLLVREGEIIGRFMVGRC